MKTTMALRIACAAWIAMASVQASAQSEASAESSTVEAPSAAAASGTMTAAEIRKTNRALRRKVYAAIVAHKEINAGNISVVARSGAVTLDGTVVDASQIDRVAEIARDVPGVSSVANRLTVKKPFGGQ
ncbi:BON domain-containing protein [Paraburkholderia guartelaensis]|uniref:BON domain-containing protein n=1 Tax=Paraburkholderia guartelaensis TaxID=2546446 RepID=UPI002AB6BAF3|nr:BON domain-containing protein [Paraburkholderia guartelaensis]